MEEKKQFFNPNGLCNDTIDQIYKFQKGIEDLRKQTTLDVIVDYIEKNIKREEVSEEIYAQMDELKECEKEAILNELPIITRQAKKNGVAIPSSVQKIQETGKLGKVPLIGGFSPKVLEKIPNLKVLTPFMWVSEKELEEFQKSRNVADKFEMEEDEK